MNKNNDNDDYKLVIKPFGRFGNNIIQLQNAINIGLQLECNTIIFKNKVIKLPIDNNKNIKKKDYINIFNNCGGNYFHIKKIKNIFPDFNDSLINKKMIRDIVLNFYLKTYKYNMKLQLNTTLCIHIRSGDIFSNKPHSLYIQPPYDFYKMILELDKFKGTNIVIVAEDNKNPTINKILENYKNVYWQKNDLNKDIEIILNSKNIVYGIGTFVPQLLYLSNSEKNVISFQKDNIKLEKYNDGFVTYQDKLMINNYIKIWKNTKEQQNIMLNFNVENNCDKEKLKLIMNKF